MKNGRRKLFLTFTEAGTTVPLRIPPHVAMAFREKCLVSIETFHSKQKAKGLMGIVSKAVGKVIGK
ncbi:MAG: hypothetical protein QMC36_02255 [Patescibacteria group bacterium]